MGVVLRPTQRKTVLSRLHRRRRYLRWIDRKDVDLVHASLAGVIGVFAHCVVRPVGNSYAKNRGNLISQDAKRFMNDPTDETNPIQLTASDLFRAAEAGIISSADSQKLIEWAEREFDSRQVTSSGTPRLEASKGFNLVTVAYYFGAMLMITACAWFLGDKWDALGSSGILVTTVIYFILAAALGWWLRNRGFPIGGGLLITVAVCLVPLITYTIQDIAGLWPTTDPGEYEDYYTYIHGSLIVMELATIVAASIALWFTRFGFLTAPLAFSFWFFSMDVAALILGDATLEGNGRAWISVIVGLITMGIGYFLDRTLNKPEESRSEDYAFWCYLFGLMAFWGGLTSMNSDSEFNKAIYAVINIGLIGIAIKLKRTVFLVFGAIGIHAYLGHLAYRVFQNSFLFPFVLAFLGLSLIIVTVVAQRYLHRMSEKSSRA